MTVRHPYFDNGGRPAALAHRGFSLDGHENSMAAFEAAVALGYRYVETDAHGTSDGVAVALHDSSLDRTTDATGQVKDLPWDTVRHAKIGGEHPVPLFEDILGTWPDLRVNVDVKGESGIGPIAEAIERTKSHDRVCVASFSTARRIATVKRMSRPVATSAGTREAAAFALGTVMRADAGVPLRDVDALQIPWKAGPMRFLGRTQIDAAHAAGRQVHVWTVNVREDMEHLLDLGVDGIVSDRADLLKEVLTERGQWA